MANDFRRLFRGLLFLAACNSGVAAEEPSWAVRDAANRLLKRHTLMLPSGDWFIQRDGHRLFHYRMPEMKFEKFGDVWRCRITSQRWRYHHLGRWKDWTDARPKFDCWELATLEVKSPATGGSTASFVDGADNFNRGTAPAETVVRRILGTDSAGVVHTADTKKPAAPPRPPAAVTPAAPAAPPVAAPEPSKVPESERGIFRTKKDGTKERVGL
jgi:hypothetical protein